MGGYKKVPKFWQKLDIDSSSVHVCSDHPEHPTIKSFPYEKYADDALAEADDLIRKLETGQIDFRRLK